MARDPFTPPPRPPDVRPVIHGTPTKQPLVKQVNGVWLPMVAADPCGCCNLCGCTCQQIVAQVTDITLTVSGLSDHDCYCVGGTETIYLSAANGTYIVSGVSGTILFGTQNSYSNPGRLYIESTDFRGLIQTYLYGATLTLGCGPTNNAIWLLRFLSHVFHNGVVTTSTQHGCWDQSAPGFVVDVGWPTICSQSTPIANASGTINTCRDQGTLQFSTDDYTLTASMRCDGCSC